jgi:PAS domain S-box-containing protein
MPTGEAARAIQQALLGDAFASASELGAFVLDEDGRYIAVNEYACELSGYDRDEIVGREIGTFNPHLVEEYAAAIDERRGRGGETHLVRKDGKHVGVGYRTSSTRVSGIPFLLVVFWMTS